jgi:hypothetical protein
MYLSTSASTSRINISQTTSRMNMEMWLNSSSVSLEKEEARMNLVSTVSQDSSLRDMRAKDGQQK